MKQEYDEEDQSSSYQGGTDRLSRQKKEDEYWEQRRSRREHYASKGTEEVWGRSPSHSELQRIYEEHDEATKRVAEEAQKAEKAERDRLKEVKKEHDSRRNVSDSDSASSRSSSSSDERRKRKKKKHKKEKKAKKDKKSKKKHKRRRSRSSDEASVEDVPTKIKKEQGEDDWVELTNEIRAKEAQKARDEEAQAIGPQIPEALLAANKADASSSYYDGRIDAESRKNMLRGEAAAMTAYVAQGKRIPRRGEIGLSSDEIATFEKVGYIMSGTRHKSMEATRLRKENQILTAEEKRLLSGLSREQRQQKEDLVMKQFESLIASKRGN